MTNQPIRGRFIFKAFYCGGCDRVRNQIVHESTQTATCDQCSRGTELASPEQVVAEQRKQK